MNPPFPGEDPGSEPVSLGVRDRARIRARDFRGGEPMRGYRVTFVLGVAHSGTTVLYRLLGRHPELGWFS